VGGYHFPTSSAQRKMAGMLNRKSLFVHCYSVALEPQLSIRLHKCSVSIVTECYILSIWLLVHALYLSYELPWMTKRT
jgi:hypothetical protein